MIEMMMILKDKTISSLYLCKACPQLNDGLLQRLLALIHLNDKVFLYIVITLRKTDKIQQLSRVFQICA